MMCPLDTALSKCLYIRGRISSIAQLPLRRNCLCIRARFNRANLANENPIALIRFWNLICSRQVGGSNFMSRGSYTLDVSGIREEKVFMDQKVDGARENWHEHPSENPNLVYGVKDAQSPDSERAPLSFQGYGWLQVGLCSKRNGVSKLGPAQQKKPSHVFG